MVFVERLISCPEGWIRLSFCVQNFMRDTWQVGDHINGRWEIFRILQGGAGIVYIVYDHAFHEVFAAKTFRDEIFACNPEIADRFAQEALAWIRMDVHPNVAQARMIENLEGRPFLFL